MANRSTVLIDDPFEDGLDGSYHCPVCGNGLSTSNFETPERDYYCPHCATRQTPVLGAA